MKDILILCDDGLSGIKEAIAAVFPKAFTADLKTIYHAADEKKALAALDREAEKWLPKYPDSRKCWKDNWDAISPIFKFSADVRKVIYITNAIESMNTT